MSSPPFERKSSRIPGDFNHDLDDGHDHPSYADDFSDIPSSLHHASHEPEDSHHNLPADENSDLPLPTTDTVLEEHEHALHHKLDDVESSFLPELSHLAGAKGGAGHGAGPTADDTFAFGVPNDNLAVRKRGGVPAPLRVMEDGSFHGGEGDDDTGLSSPQTPPGAYKTPAPEDQSLRLFQEQQDRERTPHTPDVPNTSSLETMSSSPTAAAAARTVSRVQSMATMGGYETADERAESPERGEGVEDADVTPTKAGKSKTTSRQTSPSKVNLATSTSTESLNDRGSRRPKYLNSRSSQQRLSYSSIASSMTDASDATLGADFALQSGGALPESSRLQRKPRMTLSRSTSLGSIVSGISGMSDDEGKARRAPGAPDLSTLEEENTLSSPLTQSRSPAGAPITPRASFNNFIMPTDTIIANNVRDIEVPGTFARQYRQQQHAQPYRDLALGGSVSPEKNNTLSIPGMTPGGPSTKKGMTLKEHRSTVERLGKENFDLKMKIHFLDQALQRRSEDGIKELITENVQLKSDRMKLDKDNHLLRKQARDLQRKLDGVQRERLSPNEDQGYGTDEERSPTMEEEVIYLRSRVETTEVEIEKLRADAIKKEEEKRRLAEMVRSLGDTRIGGSASRGETRAAAGMSDVGSREERDMWKDMLEAETIAREQSEEECRKLREDIGKLRSESFGHGGGRASRMKAQSRLGPGGGSVVSRASSNNGDARSVNGVGRPDGVELERLRHEVLELQKVIGAQASTLTSRNKEKERLYGEIEDLKLNSRMGTGIRSVAGDSIFERSASRARSNSRASNNTRFSRVSETEKDGLEAKINELRDLVSELKLENQVLKTQGDEVLGELDAIDAQAQADADVFNEELRLLTEERDAAMRDAEGQDEAFQALKLEAQEEIDGLGDELDEKIEEAARLEEALKQEEENALALQAEMRSASEGLLRLEEDAQQNAHRYEEVQTELEEERREVGRLGRELRESEAKIQRLSVQQESGLNEIAFLREEQDSDKIKIGDLEALVKRVHLNLDAERDKVKDLERRVGDERAQREVLANQREQDVGKVIDGLNREVAGLRDEGRRVRKQLNTREIEAGTWKDRHSELEGSLREILGFGGGAAAGAAGAEAAKTISRSGLIGHVTRMQQELHLTSSDLASTRKRLDEKETLLANRDGLLESSGLESRKLADALEREKHGRRQDKHSFEQSLKSHQQSARALSANNARISELESARQAERKKLAGLEQQYKEQLSERNAVLLTIWKKLSSMCGPDWTHNNSLINGNLPSQEVIGNILFWPGFSRNILLATKQVEGTLGQFKDRIKRVERELWKEYQQLEHTLELRTKKLERIEEVWDRLRHAQVQEIDSQRTPRASRHGPSAMGGGTPGGGPPGGFSTPEVQKLKGENRLLKAELGLLQQQQARDAYPGAASSAHYRNHLLQHQGHARDPSRSAETASLASNTTGGIPQRRSSMRGSSSGRSPAQQQQQRERSAVANSSHAMVLTRSHTTNNVIEHLVGGEDGGGGGGGGEDRGAEEVEFAYAGDGISWTGRRGGKAKW